MLTPFLDPIWDLTPCQVGAPLVEQALGEDLPQVQPSWGRRQVRHPSCSSYIHRDECVLYACTHGLRVG
jgi:hypothetical protein